MCCGGCPRSSSISSTSLSGLSVERLELAPARSDDDDNLVDSSARRRAGGLRERERERRVLRLAPLRGLRERVRRERRELLAPGERLRVPRAAGERLRERRRSVERRNGRGERGLRRRCGGRLRSGERRMDDDDVDDDGPPDFESVVAVTEGSVLVFRLIWSAYCCLMLRSLPPCSGRLRRLRSSRRFDSIVSSCSSLTRCVQNGIHSSLKLCLDGSLFSSCSSL